MQDRVLITCNLRGFRFELIYIYIYIYIYKLRKHDKTPEIK
jgi:hypothetical protein